jgi:tRNA C32,U32 (ribose-2'-O)-methylase TrmJ
MFQLSYEEAKAAAHEDAGEAGGTPRAHFEPGVQADRKKLSPTMEHLLAPVTHDNFEHLVAHWRAVMVEAGLTQHGNPDRMLADIRRLLQRASLTERDANILHGVLQAVERRFNRGGD